ARAQPAPPPAAAPQAPGPTAGELHQMVMALPQLQPDVLADKVYKELQKKIKFESRRRGF
ncbi:hypothetical protein IDH44_22015, partial [Paenibacillus sp. IB182496]